MLQYEDERFHNPVKHQQRRRHQNGQPVGLLDSEILGHDLADNHVQRT